jgi:hypothetical protein
MHVCCEILCTYMAATAVASTCLAHPYVLACVQRALITLMQALHTGIATGWRVWMLSSLSQQLAAITLQGPAAPLVVA